MSYNQKHILIHDPKTGYNAIADQYKAYHKYLDDFSKDVFFKYLPKQPNISLIDLWAGDGRLYKYLAPLKPARYVACDIAEEMLKNHPHGVPVETVVADMEDTLPFNEDSFDLATSFFVLEHVEDMDMLFWEVYRILKPGWIWIVGHFIQRREFIRKKDKDQFKVKFYHHRVEDLEKIALKHFFLTHTLPIREKGHISGYILVFKKP